MLAATEDPQGPQLAVVRIAQILGLGDGAQDLLRVIRNALTVISELRRFAIKDLQLTPAELEWALASYFFVATKFVAARHPTRVLLGYLASAWHLAHVAPDTGWESMGDTECRAAIEQG